MKKTATELRKRIVEFIKDVLKIRGYPPTFREISKKCKISSIGSVHYHLDILAKMGLLEKDGSYSRGIRLTSKAIGIPILGRVIAGVPITAHENFEGYIEPASLMIGKKGIFALKIHGDSMKDAGILEGDIIVVREQSTISNREIVVAMIDDETTVKYFYKDKDQIRLEPANERYDPIVVNGDIRIIGKVIKVIRNY
ncbi:MAG: transcriptional repressor LexA [bacterium]